MKIKSQNKNKQQKSRKVNHKNTQETVDIVTFRIGKREEGDRMVVCEEIYVSKLFMKKVIASRAFNTANTNAVITYMEATSVVRLDKIQNCINSINQADVSVSGGPGTNQALINLKSKRNRKIHYTIRIYAIGAWTDLEVAEEKKKLKENLDISLMMINYADFNFVSNPTEECESLNIDQETLRSLESLRIQEEFPICTIDDEKIEVQVELNNEVLENLHDEENTTLLISTAKVQEEEEEEDKWENCEEEINDIYETIETKNVEIKQETIITIETENNHEEEINNVNTLEEQIHIVSEDELTAIPVKEIDQVSEISENLQKNLEQIIDNLEKFADNIKQNSTVDVEILETKVVDDTLEKSI